MQEYKRLINLFFSFFFAIIKLGDDKMFKPIRTMKIKDNFYSIRTLFVSFYIYKIGNELIVFDTGINPILARRGFKKLGLDYNQVSHVFLTHSDFDHVAGLKLYKNANVYLASAEKPMIKKEKARRFFFMYNRDIKNCLFLDDGESVKIQNKTITIKVTPGHTIGSSIYFIDKEIVITGDTISLNRNGKINNFSEIQNMNHKQNKKTVELMKEQKVLADAKIIATMHHGIVKQDLK